MIVAWSRTSSPEVTRSAMSAAAKEVEFQTFVFYGHLSGLEFSFVVEGLGL